MRPARFVGVLSLLACVVGCNDPCDDAAEKLVFECAAQAPPAIGGCESDREVCVADCIVDSSCTEITDGTVKKCIDACATEEQ